MWQILKAIAYWIKKVFLAAILVLVVPLVIFLLCYACSQGAVMSLIGK